MTARGWKIVRTSIEDRSRYWLMPNRGIDGGPSFHRLSKDSDIFTFYAAAFRSSRLSVVHIEAISNQLLSAVYENQKVSSWTAVGRSLIRSCAILVQRWMQQDLKGRKPHEMLLYHGTRGDAVDGIPRFGFDNRFWNELGAFGPGAYFADDPQKSHAYTGSGHVRTIFVCYVLLGAQHVASQPERFTSAPLGTHHVFYNGAAWRGLNEFIIYKESQAKPWLRITYRP